jgi:hypothetical protein
MQHQLEQSTVFKEIVLPPAFGPEITIILFLLQFGFADA